MAQDASPTGYADHLLAVRAAVPLVREARAWLRSNLDALGVNDELDVWQDLQQHGPDELTLVRTDLLFVGGGNTFQLLCESVAIADGHDPNDVGLNDLTGLGLLGGVAVLPHFTHDQLVQAHDWSRTHHVTVLGLPETSGLYCHESTALVTGAGALVEISVDAVREHAPGQRLDLARQRVAHGPRMSVGSGRMRFMQYTVSADGTRIAFEEHGTGRPVVLTAGALSTAASTRPLAQGFAAAGWRGVGWDRRGRGASGNTAPYAPEREIEDLRAVIAAVGGDAVVFGHSGGAALTLLAAGSGVPMAHLFVSEPVLRFGHDEPPVDLADRLQALVDDHRPEEAVLTFQRENVHLSKAELDQLVASEAFADMVDLAQTTVYDTRVIAAVSTPSPAIVHCAVPMTVLRGEPAAPIFVVGCPRLAAMVPGGDFVVVAESHDHAVDPAGTVREVLKRVS